MVVHLATECRQSDKYDPGLAAPARVGFVVSQAVGPAVTRNLVKRRLRHLMRERVAALPDGSLLVVRAQPARGRASYRDLGARARSLSGSSVGGRSVVKYLLIGLLKAYRFAISPLYGQVCRYHPSCSAYALEAVTVHGSIKGSWLAVRRLARCHPWAAGRIRPGARQSFPAYEPGHVNTTQGV